MEPTKEAREEAKLNPDGWVYAIDGLRYDPERPVPPEAIQSALKVDKNAEIVGDFIPNPIYKRLESDNQ